MAAVHQIFVALAKMSRILAEAVMTRANLSYLFGRAA
jgi:hypothetical protein